MLYKFADGWQVVRCNPRPQTIDEVRKPHQTCVKASEGCPRGPCCSRLRRSHALIFEHGHCAGCLERALKVIRSDLDVNNIRTMTIACWHDAHVNLDPTNSSTQFEPRGDEPFKVCTRVLLNGVPLPLLPDPPIPTAAAGRRCSYGKQEGRLILLGAPLPTCVRHSTTRRLQLQTGKLLMRKHPHRAVHLQRVECRIGPYVLVGHVGQSV